jgi:hypothetical protein
MRIALILLSILALVFIGSISWSLLSGDGFVLPKKNTNNLSDSSTESYWRNQIKTEEKIEKRVSFATDAGEFVKNLVRFCKSVMLACGCSKPESDNNITLTIHDVQDNISTKETIDKIKLNKM